MEVRESACWLTLKDVDLTYTKGHSPPPTFKGKRQKWNKRNVYKTNITLKQKKAPVFFLIPNLNLACTKQPRPEASKNLKEFTNLMNILGKPV